jgi:beta-lactam-binding protein with PASTA domain
MEVGMRRLSLLVLTLVLIGCSSAARAQEGVVPSVLGLTADKAKKTLSDAGYDFKEGGLILSTFAMKTVGFQDPAGGDKAKKGTPVVVRLSAGLWIRNFKGEKIDDVEKTLKSYGIKFDTVDVQEANVEKGIVVEQLPTPPDLFDADTELTLRVAVGPWIPAPNLTGQSLHTAKKMLSDLKLALNIVAGPTEEFISYPPGPISGKPGKCMLSDFVVNVVTMSIPAGTLLFPGKVIDVTTDKKLLHQFTEPCNCKGLSCVLL